MTITLLEDIAAGQALVAVTNPTEAHLDEILTIGSESVIVRNRPRAGGKLILGRGALGTDRAAHSSGATLAAYSSPMLVVRAVVSDAQIKALPTTGVQLVSAPGSGMLIVPFVAVVRMAWHADYGNINNSTYLSVDLS